jgi:hypothetical protein
VCFSAPVSFASAAVIGGAGVATVALVPRARQAPLALIGVGFAAHQLVEGVIWLQLGGEAREALRSATVGVWVFFAWCLLPVAVPLALALVEPSVARRRLMGALAVAGAGVGLSLAVIAVNGRVAASVADTGSIAYRLQGSPGLRAAVPYVIVTCVPALLSSHRILRLWGVTLVVSMAATAVLRSHQFESVWCFFAAVLSMLLLAWAIDERRGDRPMRV